MSSQTFSLSRLPLQAACLTPPGRGAVAVIALVGAPTVLDDLLARFFKTPVPNVLTLDRQRTVFYGAWTGDDQEDIVLTRLSESHVEIQCHGGPAPVERILADLRQSGATVLSGAEFQRLRQPLWQWEFDQALANAQTWKVAELLLNQREVIWPKRLADWATLGKLSLEDRQFVRQQVAETSAWAGLGERLRQPTQVVLTGRPNVGKSSLINVILGYERSIVFDQPGTTRDVVTTSAALGGWPVEFSDTAGLRDGAPALESEGIARARQRLQTAELRVIVLDHSQPLTDFDRQLLDAWPEALVVVNKMDVPAAWTEPVNRTTFPLSCQTGEGVESFLKALSQRVTPSLPPLAVCWPLNERQVDGFRQLQCALAKGDEQGWDKALSGLISGGG